MYPFYAIAYSLHRSSQQQAWRGREREGDLEKEVGGQQPICMRNGWRCNQKIQKYKVSVKIVPSSLSLPGMCALVSLVVVVVVIVVVVVFRSIALQRALFLPLSFILSPSLRGNALLLSRTPFVCLNNPPSSHIPQLFTHSPTYTCIAAGSLSVGGKQRSG